MNEYQRWSQVIQAEFIKLGFTQEQAIQSTINILEDEWKLKVQNKDCRRKDCRRKDCRRKDCRRKDCRRKDCRRYEKGTQIKVQKSLIKGDQTKL